MRSRVQMSRTVGMFLILGGILLLLQYFDLLREDLFLFYLSGGFLLTYVLLGRTEHYGNIGFLIPGCILLAIAAFAELEGREMLGEYGESLFFVFLALAFFAVFLHTRTFEHGEWSTRNWPAIPGVCLVAFGGFVYLVQSTDIRLDETQTDLITAVILIGLGIYFLIKGNQKRRRVKLAKN